MFTYSALYKVCTAKMFIFTSIYIFIIPHKFQVSYDNVEPFEPYCKNNYRIRFDNELKAFCNYGPFRTKGEKGIYSGHFDLYTAGGHVTLDRGTKEEGKKNIIDKTYKRINVNNSSSINKSRKRRKQEIFEKFENDFKCVPNKQTKDFSDRKVEAKKKVKIEEKFVIKDKFNEQGKKHTTDSSEYDNFFMFQMNPSTKYQSSFYEYEKSKEFKRKGFKNMSSVEIHMYICVTVFCTIMTLVIYFNVVKFYDSCKCAMCMNYVIIRKIGNGGFGKVYIAYKKKKRKRKKTREISRTANIGNLEETKEGRRKSIKNETMYIKKEISKEQTEGNHYEQLYFTKAKEDVNGDKEYLETTGTKLNEEIKKEAEKEKEPVPKHTMEYLQFIKDKMKYMYALQNSKITNKRKSDSSNKKLYAVKKININDVNELNYYQREASVLNKIKNKYIVKYTTHCVHKVKRLFRKTQIQYVIIFEYCCNRDLFDYINKNYEHINEYMIFRWLIQITKGLHYLHSENIIHRDIKTPNIFLDEHLNARIGDLGLSRHYRIKKKKKEKNGSNYFMRFNKNKTFVHEKNKIDSKNKKNIYSSDTLSICGTSAYLAPEMNNSYYDENIDKWALGLALVEMCSGINIDTMLKSKIVKAQKKEEEDEEKDLEKFYLEDIYSYIPNFISPLFVNIIKKLLIINANERISLKEIMNNENEVKKKLSKVPFYVYLYDSKEEGTVPDVNRRSTFTYIHMNNWILRKRKRTSDKTVGTKRRNKFKLLNLKIFSHENVLIKNIQKIKTKLFISFLKTFDKKYIHRLKYQEKKNVYKLKKKH